MRRLIPFLMLLGLFPANGATANTTFPPFYADVQTEEGSFFAIRPFYSHTVFDEVDMQDWLWPLYSRKSFKDEVSSRALIFWWSHGFDASEENPRNRNWLLPVYFQGTDKNGDGYFALFPLGGTIREFLGRDEIAFALFPIFGKSRINEVKTTSVLWPIVSHTRGDGIARDRVFPIIGKSTLEGKYEKRFVLWPIWNSADYFYPGASGKSWILFPLCGRTDTELEKTWWLVPPLFRFTDGVKEDRLYCPWPFIQKVDSERQNKLYIWPLWGRKQSAGGLDRRFALWPVFWSMRTEEAEVINTRRMALPFFYREREVLREGAEEGGDPETVSSYWKVWPLMSWRREGDISRFRALELWPLKDTAPVERNWSPLWTLYQRTDHNGAVRKDFLWFVWHSERVEEQSEWSLLKGLVSYKKGAGKSQLRLFWFPHSGE